MNSSLPQDILDDLKKPFERILSTENFGSCVNAIAEQISTGELKDHNLENILSEHGTKLTKLKGETLNLILAYITLVMEDNYITVKEASNVKFLKRFLKISEGDFYSLKYYEIERVLERQFEYMYQDNKIDTEEALQKVELQSLFDLSYDQFLQLSRKAVTSAIDRGANLLDLDTFLKSS